MVRRTLEFGKAREEGDMVLKVMEKAGESRTHKSCRERRI